MKNLILSISICCLYINISCQSSNNNKQLSNIESTYKETIASNIDILKKIDLNASLDEISGIAFNPENSNLVYAIQDEEGILYTFDLSNQKIIDEFNFGKVGDYEDLATNGSNFYILKSNGDIIIFPFNHNKDKSVVHIEKKLLPKGEYESLAIDPTQNKLVILCKECKDDKNTNKISGYKLSLSANGKLDKTYNKFELDIANLKEYGFGDKKTIKPSALTYYSKTDQWLIISSIDKMLVVTDNSFTIQKVINFKRKQFEQPEGLAINNKGELYISSEIGNTNAASIYLVNGVF